MKAWLIQSFLTLDSNHITLKCDHYRKAVEQYFTELPFGFQFDPVCNFGQFINFPLGTVRNEWVNLTLAFQGLRIEFHNRRIKTAVPFSFTLANARRVNQFNLLGLENTAFSVQNLLTKEQNVCFCQSLDSHYLYLLDNLVCTSTGPAVIPGPLAVFAKT